MFSRFDFDKLINAIVIIICFSTFVVGCTVALTKSEQTKQIQAKYKCGDYNEKETEEKESEKN
jgi:hypothetical protein